MIILKFILGNDEIKIYPLLLKKIGEGSQCKVYKYKLQALKICHDFIDDENTNDFIVLKKLNTKRILVPTEILYDLSYNFKGYTMPMVKNEKNIGSITKEKFILELEEVIKELYFLANNKVIIDDWIYKNFKFDGIFRFVDSGRYKIVNSRRRTIMKANYHALKIFIFEELLINIMLNIQKEGNFQFFINQLIDECDDVVNYFKSEIKDKETLEQYVKRIVKNRRIMV